MGFNSGFSCCWREKEGSQITFADYGWERERGRGRRTRRFSTLEGAMVIMTMDGWMDADGVDHSAYHMPYPKTET